MMVLRLQQNVFADITVCDTNKGLRSPASEALLFHKHSAGYQG